jgi:riboflavin synthase|tara:strand:- start:572 stop:1171 length:600 start_codon:yes stop_codon:yes gene_type:complete
LFTGIITDVGEILSINLDSGKIKISSKFDHNDIDIGASICCSGICLTVVEKDKHKNHSYFCFEVSQETISCSSVKFWKKNTKINLEKSLRFGDEVGGHLVTGHVDCLGEIDSINKSKNSNVFKIKYPKEYKKYVASKGSICLDGISLTINEVFDDFFSVNIIPHTEENTSWSKISKGDSINIEFDVLARYVASQLEDRK